MRDKFGRTALHVAGGALPAVTTAEDIPAGAHGAGILAPLLLAHGAEPNVADDDG